MIEKPAEAPGHSGIAVRIVERWLGVSTSRVVRLVLLFLLAGEVAIRFLWFSGGLLPLSFDAAAYWRSSGEVLSGDFWLVESRESLRPPLFIWWIAAFRSVFGNSSLAALAIAQNVLGVLATILAARIAARLTGRALAAVLTLAALLLAPGRIPFDGMAMSESLFAFLLVAHAALAVEYLSAPTILSAAGAGACLGAAVLTRPTPQYLWVLFVAVVLCGQVAGANRRRSAWGDLAFFGGAMVLVLAPWVARNLILFGDVSVTRGVGVRLWAAAFSDRGAALELPSAELERHLAGIDFRQEWKAYERFRELGYDEIARDRVMVEASWRAIRLAPGDYVASAVRNWFGHFASGREGFPWYDRRKLPRPEGDSAQWIPGSSPVFRAVTPLFRRYFVYPTSWLLIFGFLCLLGGAAAAAWACERAASWWLFGTLLYFPTVTALVLYPLYRLRAPTEALLAAALGAGAVAAVERLAQGAGETGNSSRVRTRRRRDPAACRRFFPGP